MKNYCKQRLSYHLPHREKKAYERVRGFSAPLPVYAFYGVLLQSLFEFKINI
jgi:hypothetical protein